MSNVLGRTASRDESRNLPKGETIGRYSSYLDAQKAVDYLADSKFPVQQVSIIGNDLKTVERVTGRLSYPRVALASAATGAWFGLFVGFILTLFGGDSTYLPILSSIALGAVFWVLFGVIAYAFQRGKRDFTSTNQVVATSYDVIVDPAAAGEARRLLQQLPMNGKAREAGAGGQTWGASPSQPAQQHQPQQHQPTQHQPTQPPQRPQGWDAPQGQAGNNVAPVQPQTSQDGAVAPLDGAGASQNGASKQPAPASPPRGQFPDLPDGRPQYGVRVPQADPQTPEQVEGGEQGQAANEGQRSDS